MTNMLPRERAELLLAEHAAGTPIRVIAKTFGHSTGTVRDYVHGRKIPGEPAQRADEFEGFTAYCRRRLADDPHLRSAALLAEVAVLGFGGSRTSFYRALERHGIRPHPCPDCHIARFSGYAPIDLGQKRATGAGAAVSALPDRRRDPGLLPRPAQRRQPSPDRNPPGGAARLVPRQDPMARRPVAT